jgi:transcription antitermination factor NusG
MKRWGVVVAVHNQEAVAASNLRANELQVYLPQFWNGSSRQSLFGCYLFVALSRRWREVFRTRGVRSMLMNAKGLPSRIDHTRIKEWRSFENQNGMIVLPRFEVGQEVEVTRGRWSGCVGVYEGMTKERREQVLLSLLGQDIRIDVNWSSLSPA